MGPSGAGDVPEDGAVVVVLVVGLVAGTTTVVDVPVAKLTLEITSKPSKLIFKFKKCDIFTALSSLTSFL